MRSFVIVGLGPAGVGLLYELFRQRFAVAREVTLRAIAVAESESFPLRTNPQVHEAHLATQPEEQIPPERRPAVQAHWRSDLEFYLSSLNLGDLGPQSVVLVLADPASKELAALRPLMELLAPRVPEGTRYTGVFARPSPPDGPAAAAQLAANLAEVGGAGIERVVFCSDAMPGGYQAMAYTFLEMWLEEPLAAAGRWQVVELLSVTQDDSTLDRLSMAARMQRHVIADKAGANKYAEELEARLPAGPDIEATVRQIVVNGPAVLEQFPGWEPRESMMVGPSNGYLFLSRAYPTGAAAIGLELPEVVEPAAGPAPETAAPEPVVAEPEAEPAAEPLSVEGAPPEAEETAEPAPVAGPAEAAAPESPPSEPGLKAEPKAPAVPPEPETPAARAAAEAAPAVLPAPAPAEAAPAAPAAPAPKDFPLEGLHLAILAALFGIDPMEYAPADIDAWAAGALETLAAEERLAGLVALAGYARREQLLHGAAAGALEEVVRRAAAQVPDDERDLFDRLAAAMSRVIGTPADDFTQAGGALGRSLAGGPLPPTPPES